MAPLNATAQHPSAIALAHPAPHLRQDPWESDDDKLFIDSFRSAIYAFGHEKFAEFAASIAAFGFPAKVEFYADPDAGVDVLLLRMVAQEGAHWTDGSINDECSFGLRAHHHERVVEHVARIDPSAGAQGELTTLCCLHSLSPAVLDRELTKFLRAVLEVRARNTANNGGV